jgi:DNA transformation protein
VTASDGFIAHLKDLLGELGHITVRRMFGGAGVYCDGQVFAFVDDDVLYLKTDEDGRTAFEAEDMGPFTYTTKHGPGQLTSYWRAPERLLDEPDEMRAWVKRALAVARLKAAAKAKPVKSKKAKRK